MNRVQVNTALRLRCGKVALVTVFCCLLGLGPVKPLSAQPPDGSLGLDTSTYLRQQLEPTFYSLPENVEVLGLENGLQVILMHNPAQPMVGIYTQVKVGSAWEDFRTSGMSHMLEHLLFNGSELFSQEELYDLADLHGAYNNANTTDFYTNYMLVIPTGSLETGLLIQSQMLFHSTLPDDKFAKEKGIVVGELVSSRDRPEHFSEQTLRQVIFQGSSLALPTLGTRSTIENMERDDVYGFYKNHYVPNNMILTLAGNFDRDEALALLEQYYGVLPPGSVERPDLALVDFYDRTHTVVRRGGDRRLLALAFEAPGYQADDYFPFLVMTQLLDAEGSGILTRALDGMPPEERPELAVWWEQASGFSRLVLEFRLPAAADPERFYRLVQEAGAAALEFGVTRDDIQEIVQMEETHTLLDREQLRHTGIITAEPIVHGGPDFFVSYLPRLREVSAEDVMRVLESYLLDSPCLALLIEPGLDREGETVDPDTTVDTGGMQMPEGMQVPAAMLEAMRQSGMSMGGTSSDTDAADSTSAGGQLGAAVAATERPAPTSPPAPITVTSLPVERTELQNGVILVSQQNPASSLLAIHLTVRNRAVVDADSPGALNLVHRMLMSGVAGCDATCLSRRLRRLGAVVKLVDNPHIPMDDYYTTGRFSYIRVEVAAENGPELLQLLAEMSQHASFLGEDFERERRQQIALLEDGQGSARFRADQLLRETLYGEHPLVRPAEGEAAALNDLNYDAARRVYRDAFTPQNLIFAVVSPYPHADLARQLEELLPGRGKPTAGLPPLPLTASSRRVTESLGGEMAAIRSAALLQVDPADEKPLEILCAILSDRLARDLRESQGLSYSVGATVSIHGGEAEFETWLNPPRERVAEGEQALSRFLAEFDAGSISQDELDKIRSSRVGRYLMRRLSSLSQAYYLAMAELDGDVSRASSMLGGYDDITLADLRRVGGKYLANLPLVTVVVD
ncbi:MAG: insulinase family protein [bacterium]